MESEVLVKLNPTLAAWIDKRARAAHTDASAVILEELEETRQKEESQDAETEDLLRKLREKFPPSPELQALKGSIGPSTLTDEDVDAIRYEYLREKHGL